VKLTLGKLRTLIREAYYDVWRFENDQRTGKPTRLWADSDLDAAERAGEMLDTDPLDIDVEEVQSKNAWWHKNPQKTVSSDLNRLYQAIDEFIEDESKA